MTPAGEHSGVCRTILRAIAAAGVCSLALATGTAFGAGGVMPQGWTHAEINYTAGGSVHTLILDRGRVTAVSPGSMTLREQDGTTVQIALSSSTQVNVDGQPGSLANIGRFDWAMAERIDGGPATQVRIHVPARLAFRATRR